MPRSGRVDNRERREHPPRVHSKVHRVSHAGVHRRIIDSIAWISERREASSFTRSMIFWTAEITVVWCLPPNARARSGYESLVWWREMYIATARGVATDLWRRSDLMSLGLSPSQKN